MMRQNQQNNPFVSLSVTLLNQKRSREEHEFLQIPIKDLSVEQLHLLKVRYVFLFVATNAVVVHVVICDKTNKWANS